MIEVTVTDVLEALRVYSERPEGGEGARVVELCELSGRTERTVRKELAQGVADGTILLTKRVIKTLNGRSTTVSAYKRVINTTPKKGKK